MFPLKRPVVLTTLPSATALALDKLEYWLLLDVCKIFEVHGGSTKSLPFL
jgi:hypothetical protein